MDVDGLSQKEIALLGERTLRVLYCQLQRDEILRVFKVEIIIIGFEEFCNFVRIDVVRVNKAFVA